MNLEYRGLSGNEAMTAMKAVTSPEILIQRGIEVAKVMRLESAEPMKDGEPVYHTAWGRKTASGVYCTLLALVGKTTEIGADTRFGIYNSVAEAWWLDESNRPIVFTNYELANNWLFLEREREDTDMQEGDIQIYKTKLVGELDRDFIPYSRHRNEMEAFMEMQRVHFKIADLLFERSVFTACTTAIQGYHFFLHIEQDSRYSIRFSPYTKAEKNGEWLSHGSIEGIGVSELQAATKDAENWLKNPTFVA